MRKSRSEAESSIQPYLDAYVKSSDRVRSILYVVLVGAVIIVTAIINTSENSWFTVRADNVAILSRQLDSAMVGHPEFFTDPQAADKALTDPAARAARKKLRDTLSVAKVYSKEQMLDRVAEREKIRSEGTKISIPFFGTLIDINDLPIVSAVGLLFMALILMFSVNRVRLNLRIVREEADDDSALWSTYRKLSMGEVLFVPQPLAKDSVGSRSSVSSLVLNSASALLPLLLPAVTFAALLVASESKPKTFMAVKLAVFSHVLDFSNLTDWLFNCVLLVSFITVALAIALTREWRLFRSDAVRQGQIPAHKILAASPSNGRPAGHSGLVDPAMLKGATHNLGANK